MSEKNKKRDTQEQAYVLPVHFKLFLSEPIDLVLEEVIIHFINYGLEHGEDINEVISYIERNYDSVVEAITINTLDLPNKDVKNAVNHYIEKFDEIRRSDYFKETFTLVASIARNQIVGKSLLRVIDDAIFYHITMKTH